MALFTTHGRKFIIKYIVAAKRKGQPPSMSPLFLCPKRQRHRILDDDEDEEDDKNDEDWVPRVPTSGYYMFLLITIDAME